MSGTNPGVGNLYPSVEGQGVIFPMTEERLIADTDELLKKTIFAESDVVGQRLEAFDSMWAERWKQDGIKSTFQVDPSESPFAKYSSQGWKVHIVYAAGREKEVSRFLFGSGLYFKTEAGMGTYFNGTKESGSTIYIGSEPALEIVADRLQILESVLTGGPASELAYASGDTRTVYQGSGSDIEVRPKVLARFDVAKTPYGWFAGNGKYAEHGLPSWAVALGIPSGLPLLKEDELSLWELERTTKSPNALFIPYAEAQKRAQAELVSDFGEGFVLGYTNLLERVATT